MPSPALEFEEDFIVDLILDYLDIHFDIRADRPVWEIVEGDIPFVERLEVLARNPQVREAVESKVLAAQAAGRAFALPAARDLAAARERRLAR